MRGGGEGIWWHEQIILKTSKGVLLQYHTARLVGDL